MQTSGESKKSRDRVEPKVLSLFNRTVLPYITYIENDL